LLASHLWLLVDLDRITKTGDNDYEQETFDNFSFVPMLSGKRS